MKLATTTGDFSAYTSSQFEALQYLHEIGYNGYFTLEVGGVFAPSKQRRFYEADQRLQKAPLSMKRAYERYLFEAGKCILEAYDCFEA